MTENGARMFMAARKEQLMHGCGDDPTQGKSNAGQHDRGVQVLLGQCLLPEIARKNSSYDGQGNGKDNDTDKSKSQRIYSARDRHFGARALFGYCATGSRISLVP